MPTIRLSAAEATVRFLAAQETEIDGRRVPLFGGVFAIFGHGNVAGLGPALHATRRRLPVFRAHNEQAMAHAAIAYAKTYARRRMMACTSSIGPGATNMVTAAALAHVNRLPVLFLPGDIFVSRRPDPVLQQIEHAGEPGVTANDCFRPVSRYFDRITRPEQLLVSLPAALRTLTDPAECGPATIAFPQDVQAESLDCPVEFFRPRLHRARAVEPDAAGLAAAAAMIRRAKRPLLIAGGGVKYAGAEAALDLFARRHGMPVAETQAGKGCLGWDHPLNAGALGVTGAASANALAARADVVLAVGTRLADFTTGSRALFAGARLVALNVASFDAAKHGAVPLVADAARGLVALGENLQGWRAPATWQERASAGTARWQATVTRVTASPRRSAGQPTDAQVLGAVNRAMPTNGVVVCAAGGLPGELHRLWRASDAISYHVEYGYSCMGYEIAGGLGVKMAVPERDVVVLVGDGSYLMMNSEIATAVAMKTKLTIVVLDNRGFGCISRLQKATGGAPFNNLLREDSPAIDFAAHAAALGAEARRIEDIAALEVELSRALRSRKTTVLVIATDPAASTTSGGAWWDVPVTETPRNPEQTEARAAYERSRRRQRAGG